MSRIAGTLILVLLAGSAFAGAADNGFTVRLGDSKKFDGGKLVVKFLSVESDNRCPPTVTCIAAGDAAILVSSGHVGGGPGGAAMEEHTLHTNSDPREFEFDGGTLRLESLSPKAEKGQTDYVATFRFTR